MNERALVPASKIARVDPTSVINAMEQTQCVERAIAGIRKYRVRLDFLLVLKRLRKRCDGSAPLLTIV